MHATRVHYLDWLRWSAVLAVVAFHAVLPFGSFGPWHIQNAERIDLLGLATALLAFAFPVFFVLAGASARFALQTRTMRAFLSERTMRLLIPFVVGTIVLTPLTGYIIAVHRGSAGESLLAYLIAYPGSAFERDVLNVGFSPLVFQAAMHLWFLGWLFLLAVLGSPILAFLATERGTRLLDTLAGWSRWRGSTLLFAVPITLVALPFFAVSSATAMYDWASFAMYGAMFVLGYAIFSEERLVAAVRRDLAPAMVATILALAGNAFVTGFEPVVFAGGAHRYDATYVLVVSMIVMANVAVVLSLLGVAMRSGFLRRPLPRLAGATTLPTYVLHFPIVIAISAVVVLLPLDVWTKIAINVALGVALSVLAAVIALRLPGIGALLGTRESRAAMMAARLRSLEADPAPHSLKEPSTLAIREGARRL